MNFLAGQTLIHRLKNGWFPKETGCGWGDVLGGWHGNAIKSGHDDLSTIINTIKFIEKLKKGKRKLNHSKRKAF